MLKFAPLVWQNLGRNKLRTALTGAAIAFAVALVCVLRTMPAGLDAMLASMATEHAHLGAQRGRPRLRACPTRTSTRCARCPASWTRSRWTWFGGVFDADKGVEFPNFAVDAGSRRRRLRGLEHRSAGARGFPALPRRRDRRPQVMEKQGWKVGDLITLKSTIYPVEAAASASSARSRTSAPARLVPARVPRPGAARAGAAAAIRPA